MVCTVAAVMFLLALRRRFEKFPRPPRLHERTYEPSVLYIFFSSNLNLLGKDGTP